MLVDGDKGQVEEVLVDEYITRLCRSFEAYRYLIWGFYSRGKVSKCGRREWEGISWVVRIERPPSRRLF